MACEIPDMEELQARREVNLKGDDSPLSLPMAMLLFFMLVLFIAVVIGAYFHV